MKYLFWWLIITIPCFFAAYCNGADLNFRLKSTGFRNGFWKFHLSFFREGFHLLLHDYFGVYCPWSWERSRRYRLLDMREYLGIEGRYHDRLGHITSADCDNPEKQEMIACYAYVSRTRYWASGAFNFLVAPIPGSFIIISIAVGAIVALGQSLVGRSTKLLNKFFIALLLVLITVGCENSLKDKGFDPEDYLDLIPLVGQLESLTVGDFKTAVEENLVSFGDFPKRYSVWELPKESANWSTAHLLFYTTKRNLEAEYLARKAFFEIQSSGSNFDRTPYRNALLAQGLLADNALELLLDQCERVESKPEEVRVLLTSLGLKIVEFTNSRSEWLK